MIPILLVGLLFFIIGREFIKNLKECDLRNKKIITDMIRDAQANRIIFKLKGIMPDQPGLTKK